MKKILAKSSNNIGTLEIFPQAKEHILTRMSCDIAKEMLKNDCIEIEEDTNKISGNLEIYMSTFVMSPFEYRKAVDILKKLKSLNSIEIDKLIDIFRY